MNTTIANHVINMTPTTMPVDDTPSDEGDNSVGAYTTVLAVTAHIVAMIFGGGKCIAVLTAVLAKRNINKYSYLLVLALLAACCCVNFVYSPLEISDLLTYHYHQRHPCTDFLAAKTSLYIFLFTFIGIIIVLITLEAIFRPCNCFGHILQKIWPLTACLFALAWSGILTGVLSYTLAESSPSSSSSSNSDTDSVVHSSYVIIDRPSQIKFELITILMIFLVFLALLVLLIQLLRSCVYWEGGHPHFRKKKMSLAMPEFLISQSQNDCDEEYTGGYDNVNEPSTSRSPSPSTPKLLMVSPDSASIKGGDGMPLSQTTPKSSGNRLGINMAQVLGRRRHTICQISDSTSTPAPPDPINKAKQYNYVRKFSVDISALQAQLQNPKIFKEAPFQSDMDLTKRAAESDKNNRSQKPLQPLQPLNLKLDEKKSNSSSTEKDTTTTVTTEAKVETPQSAGLSIPPPVIMVSNDDAIPEKDDSSLHNEEKENVESDKTTKTATGETTVAEENNKTNLNHDTTKSNNTNSTNRPEIPTSLSLKGDHNSQIIKIDNAKNDVIAASSIPPALESSPIAVSCGSPHDNDIGQLRAVAAGGVCIGEDNGHKLARLSAGMCVTFIITMLPVHIVHALRLSMSANTFVSITTCTLAISTALQTIVYPHLIACCDGVVRRAVRTIKRRVKKICLVHVCRREDGNNDDDDEYDGAPQRSHNIDDTSSTSHV